MRRVVVTIIFLNSIFARGASAPDLTGKVYYKALYSKVLTFDPAQLTDTASLSVSNQIYEGLLDLDEHNEVRPALAESWNATDGGKRLIFQLRKGVKFHNGKEMDAQDCVASFEHVLSPLSKVSTYYNIIQGGDEFHRGVATHVTGLKAVSKYTFEIALKNPYPPFATVLTGATARILPAPQLKEKSFFEHPVGTGPFELNHISDQEIILTANSRYWATAPKLSKIYFKVLDEAKGIDEAKNGKLHDLSTYSLNGNEPIFKVGTQISVPVIETWLIGLNTRLPPFNDINVRRAFISSISSQEFVRRFYPGQTPATGYIPPVLPGFLNTVKSQPRGTGSKKSIILNIPAELSKAKEMKLFFEQEFRNRGFNLTVELTAWDDFMKRYTKKTMQAFLFYMNADYPDTEFLARNFESENEDNFTGVKSKKLDRLIKLGRITNSRIERAKIYREFGQTLQDEALTLNLMHYRAHYWVASCVHGLDVSSLGDPYISYRPVYLEGNCEL